MIHSFLAGYQLYQKKKFKEAISEVIKPIRKACPNLSSLNFREEAIRILHGLQDASIRQESLFNYYNGLCMHFKNRYNIRLGAQVTKGEVRVFYEHTNTTLTL